MVVGEFTEATEVAVLGAGPGGYVAAIRLAQYGKEVTLISEEKLPGGVCLRRGCIPSKALIEVTKLYQRVQGAERMGLKAKELQVDFNQTQSWKEGVTKKLSDGILGLLKQNGVKYLVGKGHLTDPHQLKVQTEQGVQTLQFKKLILATGSLPIELKGFPFDEKEILSSTGALLLTKAPSSLLVIGGGYIGLEMAGVYAGLGSKVTVVEATDSLLPGLDSDLLRPLQKRLKATGVELHLNTLAKGFEKKQDHLAVLIEDTEKKTQTLEVEKVLVAVGRRPNTEGLGLDKIGLNQNSKGYVKTNDRCQSNLEHIYAIGDVAGGMQLAHKASREGKVAAANIAGLPDGFDNQVPAVIFTDPEIAYVGLQESEANEQGIEVITGMFPFAALGRAQTMDETEGFIKVVAEKETQRVLGVQMVGPHVSDLISEATLGIEMGAFLEDFSLTIHPHPTLPEALEEAMESALGMPIHRFQRKK